MNISPPNNSSLRHLSRVSTLTVLLLFFVRATLAQIPSGYYDAAIGKSGAELQVALYNIIKTNHTSVSYTPGV